MKHFVLSAFFAILAAATAQAQFSLGIKGGFNTQFSDAKDIVVNNGSNSLKLAVEDVKFGTQFGAYVRIGGRVYLQPELMFNSTRTDFKVSESSVSDVIKTERYNYLDMPVLVGFSLGPLLLHGGPVGHYYINSRSELTDIDGYKARFKEFTWGYLAGLTIGKGRISADLRYEGNFTNQGNHITFFGDNYNFSTRPSRFLVNLNIKIF